MSNIFDSHCHPQLAQYDADREEVIRRAQASNTSLICIGTDIDTSKQAIELAQKYEGVWATVGLHPNDNLKEEFDIEKYRELLKQPKVVAVGEIGLDYFRTEEKDQPAQKEKFIKQLELAKSEHFPVVLHSRDSNKGSTGRAYPDMIEILKQYPEIRGVVHSCTASIDEAKQFLDVGLYLGFNGIITFASQYHEVVKYAPLNKILLETDAPYLTPEPYRGQRNEPAHVIEVAKKVAELKGETLEKVIEQTTLNCKELFQI
ncbi:MAG: TatD family hydrolase [Patescibacteria group bacterium]